MLNRAVVLTENSDLPIIEFGAGLNSSPFLNNHPNKFTREIISIEESFKWHKKLFKLGINTQHIEDINEILLFIKDLNFSVALVDSTTEIRLKLCNYLADKSLFIIAHDSEDQIYGYDKLTCYMYKYEDKRQIPHTLMLSNYLNYEGRNL